MSIAFDVDKFRKVRALADAGSTAGERAAATSRLEAMARKAGLSLEEALLRDDAHQRDTANPWSKDAYWEGFWEHLQENARKEQEKKRAAAEEQMADRWAEEALKEKARFEATERIYGPYEAAMAETELERFLREALEPMAVWKKYDNSDGIYIDGYGDWTRGHPSKPVMDALDRAYALPTDIFGAWEEYSQWVALDERRFAYSSYYETPLHVYCRKAALESILDTMPVGHWGDLDLRMRWRRYQIDRWHSVDDELAFLKRLEADLETLRDMDVGRNLRAEMTRRSGRQRRPPSGQLDLFTT